MRAAIRDLPLQEDSERISFTLLISHIRYFTIEINYLTHSARCSLCVYDV